MNEAPTIDPEQLEASEGSEHLYSVPEVARLFELPQSRVRYWSQTGFITPSVRRGNRRYYTFQDLISIKVAKELLDAGLPLQRVRRSLDALRFHRPRVDAPLARLRIRSEADRILVEEGETTFEATTGQLLLDFDVEKLRDQVAEVLTLPWVGGGEHPGATPALPDSAYEAFQRGLELESSWDGISLGDAALESALAAYERATELDPQFAAAWTNLGSLLAVKGELDRARDCFDHALRCDPEQPEAQCNLAELALRAGEVEIAIAGFRQALRIDPEQLEAHYGLARALLEVGGKGQALAHLERFCRAVDRLPTTERNAELVVRRRQVGKVVDILREELS